MASDAAENCSAYRRGVVVGSFGGGEFEARLRSEGSQSSGGNAIRQKSGDGSENSMPTSILPASFWPMKETMQGSSSAVLGFTMAICCARPTLFVIFTMQPFAFTATV